MTEEAERLVRMYREDRYYFSLMELIGYAMELGKSVDDLCLDIDEKWVQGLEDEKEATAKGFMTAEEIQQHKENCKKRDLQAALEQRERIQAHPHKQFRTGASKRTKKPRLPL